MINDLLLYKKKKMNTYKCTGHDKTTTKVMLINIKVFYNEDNDDDDDDNDDD